MSEPKVIWSGTYAGIPADVRVVNGKPVPFLAGTRTTNVCSDGIVTTAVTGLVVERDVLLERLSKLEAATRFAYDSILESSVCDEPCPCIDCQMLEKLGAALGIPRIGET